MKVLFLIPHLSGGGTEKVLSTLSCRFPSDVEQVIVVFESKISYPYVGKIESLNSPNKNANFLVRFFLFFQRLIRYRRVLKRVSPDLVMSFMDEAHVLNLLTAQNPILAIHSNVSQQPKTIPNLIARFCIRLLYSRGRLITVSDSLRQDLIETFGVDRTRIEVIYNPVEIEKIQALSTEDNDLSADKKEALIITCGRLEVQKGHWHLIKAVAQLRQKTPCQLIVIGEGSMRSRLVALCEELNVQDCVSFLGWKENPYSFFSKADIFVLPSNWETFGLVLVEALACETPVISSDCPVGPREILSSLSPKDIFMPDKYELCKYGILIPPFKDLDINAFEFCEEEHALTSAIERLLTDPILRKHYEALGKERIGDFDANLITQQYLVYLKRVYNATTKF
jgi:glycosyltransferase involved in cell wall biosynthesis